jgi:ethanolamine utilization protein EutM
MTAVGMIETRGLVGAISAADAAVKTADVHLLGTERVDAALVTVTPGSKEGPDSG